MKLSIIIPVYNNETLIKRCLDSVLQQNLPAAEYEIIIVDDGSTDHTYDTIVSLCRNQDNILILRQENKHIGGARNLGLEYAKGEYIWFVDSDDYIATDCCGELYGKARETDADMLCFNFYIIDPKGISGNKDYARHLSPRVHSGRQLMRKKAIFMASWLCWYKRSMLDSKSLRFKERLAYEDNEFLIRAYYHASKVTVLRQYYYYNDVSYLSTIRTVSPRPIFDLLKITGHMLDFCGSVPNSKDRRACRYYISMVFNTAINRVKDQPEDIRKEFVRRLKPIRNKIVHTMFFSLYPKYCLEAGILSLSTGLLIQSVRYCKNVRHYLSVIKK